MPVEAAEITFDEIEKKFAAIPVTELKETEKFLAGDHWQTTEGWIGWRPPLGSSTFNSDWQLIEQGFTPKNVIKGMVKRLRGAVLGNEPDFAFVSKNRQEVKPNADGTPPEPSAEEKRWKEIDEIVTRWWSDKRVHDVIKRYIDNYAAYGKAGLNIYIPSGYVEKGDDGKTRLKGTESKDLADVLSRIYVDCPRFESVIDVMDRKFGEKYTILKYPADELTGDVRYELHYVDEEGKTHIRQVSQIATAADLGALNGIPGSTGPGGMTISPTASVADREITVDLGGELTSYVAGEFSDAMISKPVKQQQKQLNHAKTMEGYAIANINVPETVFINADLETEKKKGPDGKLVETVRELWRGVSTFINLIGVRQMASDGSEVYATPDVKYKPAADPSKFAEVAENNTRDMHQEAGMVYILLSSSPYPSGESRIESMTDYLILLIDYKTLMDTVGRWLLTTVLRLAFNFTDETDQNDKFDVIFATKLTVGRVSVEDKKQMLEEVNARLRSRRNYMIATGVTDDPTLELQEVAKDPPTPAEQELKLKEQDFEIRKTVAERPPTPPSPAQT